MVIWEPTVPLLDLPPTLCSSHFCLRCLPSFQFSCASSLEGLADWSNRADFSWVRMSCPVNVTLRPLICTGGIVYLTSQMGDSDQDEEGILFYMV